MLSFAILYERLVPSLFSIIAVALIWLLSVFTDSTNPVTLPSTTFSSLYFLQAPRPTEMRIARSAIIDSLFMRIASTKGDLFFKVILFWIVQHLKRIINNK